MYQEAILTLVTITKDRKPLVPSITNKVTMQAVANTQIAVGGSPAMFFLADEGRRLAEKCAAMYINLGTLSEHYRELVPQTILQLKKENKPWLLDPVGLGKGQLHNELIAFIHDHPPTIIKGNASEIIRLANMWRLIETAHQLKGVDSQDPVEAAKEAAIQLGQHIKTVIVVTGPIDLITDGKQIIRSHGGSDWMETISGMGCMLGGVMSVFLADANPMTAAITAVNAFNLAGQNAAQTAKGPGTFFMHFLDALFNLSADEISQHPLKMEDLHNEL
ncbi:hydroxyethylthiazole kinase [Fundicoccus sp. Sow4_H7]|uniref:hydroxyethylthiazole kinase n=1 Tax=Fundicoccus sp. Sow4_H7 TaxID=3438784 RepID=UPI003F8F0348